MYIIIWDKGWFKFYFEIKLIHCIDDIQMCTNSTTFTAATITKFFLNYLCHFFNSIFNILKIILILSYINKTQNQTAVDDLLLDNKL